TIATITSEAARGNCFVSKRSRRLSLPPASRRGGAWGFQSLMRLPRLFYSFRTRLLLLMALLLVATLGVQYYLSRREEKLRSTRIAEQEQALAASIELALDSITTPTKEYLWQMDEKRPCSFLKDQQGRVQNILVVNEQGRIDDSLLRQWAPTTLDDGTAKYFNISEVPLPRLVESGQTTADIRQLQLNAPPPVRQPLA